MIIVYQARDYDASKVEARYVRYSRSEGVYRFCEVGPPDRNGRRWDIRQGVVDEETLPGEVAAAARQWAGVFPSYVEWPL